jgi:uncharacterized protein (DUF1800 family)
MFGPRPGDVGAINTMGYDDFLQVQLNPDSINDSVTEGILAGFPNNTLNMSYAQLYDLRNTSDSREPFYQVRHRTWIRRIHSDRQLYERMVDFWHDHFNIYYNFNPVRSLWPKWDDTIRQHAFGNFREFLEATAKHPCMLYYLDNYLNTDAGPNENYARELFELHTLGDEHYAKVAFDDPDYDPTQHYIDADVYGAADCFTGWTYERDSDEPGRGAYKYVDSDHNRGFKIVLGQTFLPDQGPEVDGKQVLDILANHEGTSKFIARKLCVRFIDDNPPQSIVDSTAQVFRNNASASDQIKRVLNHLLSSSEFKNSMYRVSKMKRPIDWLVSTCRALGMSYVRNNNWYWQYDPIGQPMFSWRPPDGAPDTLDYWASSNGLLTRVNMIYRIASGWYDGQDPPIDFDANSVTPANLETPRQVAEFWLDRVLQRPVSPASKTGAIMFVAEGRNWDQKMPASQRESKIKYLAAFCTMLPEFQRR